jgi:hypothetical protein
MDDGLGRVIQQLPRFTVAVLRTKYEAVLGEEAKIPHKQFLVRRIAWELQAQALGNLSERARSRIAQIADQADLSRHALKKLSTEPTATVVAALLDASRRQRDARLPPAGTLLRRRSQGREIVVKVLADGFEYDCRPYRSLSAIARQVTGTHWNGLLFFGLTERRHE